MKPSPNKLRQIAGLHAVRRRSGDRVPMRMEGWELLTETFRCSLKIDFHNAFLPEEMVDYRLLESQLSRSMEMNLEDQEFGSCEKISSGFFDCSICLDSPLGKEWQMKSRITGDVHIGLVECRVRETVELANLINEPPISISYEGTTKPDLGSQDTDLHYNTYDPDPPDKSISQGTTSYEDGITYRYGTSEPPEVRGLSLTTGNPSPPGCISYPLSETLWGDHMQRVQAMESTLTTSVSLGMLGMWYGKRSLSDYHSYTEDAEHHYSPLGIIFQDYAAQIQHL